MTGEAMCKSARGCCLALVLAGALPLSAQLVIDPDAVPAYPMPPKVETAEEEEAPKPPPTYAGERMEILAGCKPEALGAMGMVCSAASPCEMSLELTAAREAGDNLVVIGDVYATSATVESIVLRSGDGGETWTEAADRIAGAALDELQFADGEHGWIVGRDIVGGSQQPFLLATSDGGKSWNRRDIEEDEDYRGSVLQLRFDSPEHGFLIVERPAGLGDPYEMRETFNGGRSWSLRQVTAERPALPGSRRRIPEPGVRVRAEAAEDLYVVEQKMGDSWQSIGSFQGSAGICGAE